MNIINQYVAKFHQLIFFIVIALTVCSQSFCEESKINEEIIDEQYKSYINEFQSAFAKQMEREFSLKWIEGDVLHNFSRMKFYAHRRATLEEARALALSVLSRLDEKIHADPKTLSYFNRLSLTPESIGVDISFVNLHHWGYDDGSIDNVYSNYSENNHNEFQKRYLRYTTTDPFSDYSADKDETFSTHFEETFEEAIKLNAAINIINPAIHEPTRFEEELDQTLISFEEEMKKKHGLLFQSSGWMVAGKSTSNISEIRTKCTYLYPVDCQEARALILLAAERLLTLLNSNEILRPYLKDYPFAANRLKLRMLFREERHFVGPMPYYDKSMESAVLSGNTITYYYHIPNDSGMHDRIVYAKESYQEAQKALENTPPLPLFEKFSKSIKKFLFNFRKFFENVFIFFSLLLFFIIINSWLFTIPIIIGLIFILRRVCRPS